MFNKLILAGNLTRDPEIRYTPGGIPVTTLSIAVNSRYKQGDKTKEEVLFMDSVIFGKLAENCKEYLSKGSPVIVEGRLRERRWEQDGFQRSKFELMVKDVRFLPSGKSKVPANGITEIDDGITENDEGDMPF